MSDSEYYTSSEEETPKKKTQIMKKAEIIKKSLKKEMTREEVEKERDKLLELIEFQKKSEVKELNKRINKEEILKGLDEKTDNPYIEEQKNDLKERAKKAKIIANKRGNYNKHKVYDYLFVTINPIECEIKDLKNIINRLSESKLIKIQSYVFEQRGETKETIGKGKHIHMIIKKKEPKSKCILTISSALKKSVLIEDNNKINIIEISNKKGIEYYMQGKKTPEKLTKMKYTNKWRKYNKLKKIYVLKGNITEYTAPKAEITKKEVEHIKIGEETYIIVEVNNKKISIKLNDYLNK